MNPLGTFTLPDVEGQFVPCTIEWIAEVEDWDFAEDWKKQDVGNHDPRIRDSIDYALTGAKRWRWLSEENFCARNANDAAKRIKKDGSTEFAFALALSVSFEGRKQTIGFCYARRLWLGTVCLEFLGTHNIRGFSGIGSLLLYAVAEASRRFKAVDIWGECTSDSQGFYRKTKAKLLHGELKDALKPGNSDPKHPRDWQLPGDVDDRFTFRRRELILMSDLFRAAQMR